MISACCFDIQPDMVYVLLVKFNESSHVLNDARKFGGKQIQKPQ